MNSLWGKFGQNPSHTNYDFLNDYNKLIKLMLNPNIDVTEMDIISEKTLYLSFIENSTDRIDPDFVSEITAIFTTANARLRLYDMLTWVHPSQLIYCDTDSVFILYDETNPLHKYPSNEATDLPESVRFGDGLGQWKNELGADHIIEMVVGGAKCYAYKTSEGKTEDKVKGITMDANNSNYITYDNFKKNIMGESTKKFENDIFHKKKMK